MIALTIAQLARIVSGRPVLVGSDTLETVVSGAVDTDSRNIGPGDVFEKRNIRLVHDSGLLHYSLQVI